MLAVGRGGSDSRDSRTANHGSRPLEESGRIGVLERQGGFTTEGHRGSRRESGKIHVSAVSLCSSVALCGDRSPVVEFPGSGGRTAELRTCHAGGRGFTDCTDSGWDRNSQSGAAAVGLVTAVQRGQPSRPLADLCEPLRPSVVHLFGKNKPLVPIFGHFQPKTAVFDRIYRIFSGFSTQEPFAAEITARQSRNQINQNS